MVPVMLHALVLASTSIHAENCIFQKPSAVNFIVEYTILVIKKIISFLHFLHRWTKLMKDQRGISFMQDDFFVFTTEFKLI